MSTFLECSICAQLNQVEPCIECNKNLCVNCLNEHYTQWRANAVHKSENIENSLLNCKSKLGN